MMWPFSNKTKQRPRVCTDAEVNANRKKVTNVVEDAKRTNQHLADVLEKNNITIQIFRAAGGKQKRKHS